MTILGLGSVLFVLQPVHSAPPCSSNPNGSRTIETVAPNKGAIGSEAVEVAITGCDLNGSTDTFSVYQSPTSEIPGTIIDEYPTADRMTVVVVFDLKEPPALVGVHDIKVNFPSLFGGGVYIKPDSFTIYAPDVVGWGWFGASSGNYASPGWLSLNCRTDVLNGNPDTCYDASTGLGTTYGIGMYRKSPTRSEIRGYTWFGVSEDDDSNSNNPLPTGWVQFNPSGPYPDPVVLGLPGTVQDFAYYNPTTDAVQGWARSLTLQQYGSDRQCAAFSTRTWTAPLRLVDGLSAGTTPRIAAGPDNTVHAVWVRSGVSKIFYRSFSGGVWQGTSINLTDAIGAGASLHPDIVVDKDNIIHVVFEDSSTSPRKLRYATCSDSNLDCTQSVNWISEALPVPAVDEKSPNISVTPNSTNITVMIAFQRGNGASSSAASYVKTGASWLGPLPATSSTTTGEVRVEADYENNFHAVWPDQGRIYYRKFVSGAWEGTGETRLTDLTSNADHPDISVDPSAGVHVVYDSNAWTGREIGYVRYSNTSGWTVPQRLTNENNRVSPSIVITGEYRRQVVYRDTTGTAARHREAAMGAAWSSEGTVANTSLVPQMAVSPNNTLQVILQSTVDNRIYHTNSNPLQCAGGAPATDWGWISMRGGIVDPASLGRMRSCYDCTGADCKICEVDDSYNADDDPPLYACNQCTGCGVEKKCRRSGDVCTNDPSVCPDLVGETNDCTPVCDQCASCNLWGVSVEGTTGDEGRFHGMGWSAGGTLPVDTSLPSGTFDSGVLEIESDISQANGAPCPPSGNCQCATLNSCQSWGWDANNGTVTQNCLSRGSFAEPMRSALTGWGACLVSGNAAGAMNFRFPVSVPDPGYYFLSFRGWYDQDEEQVRVVVQNQIGGQNILDGVDLSDVIGGTMRACTFGRPIYLDATSTLHFSARSNNPLDTVILNSYRLTSLPSDVTAGALIDCLTGLPLTSYYTPEVGFGWVDFSDVSLIQPWTETRFGDIYSRGSIGETGGAAPAGAYNSSYLIETAPGGVITWTTPQLMYEREGLGSSIFLPAPGTGYRNILGWIDYAGLTAGGGTSQNPGQNTYSNRVIDTFLTDNCDDGEILWSNIENEIFPGGGGGIFQGSVVHIGRQNQYCKLVINSPLQFENGVLDTHLGKGLFVIEGDLEISANISYEDANISRITQLASIGWLVKGDIIVDPLVTQVVGAYVALGCEAGGNCPVGGGHDGTFATGFSTADRFVLQGLALAKRYALQRTASEVTAGSEQFINDGRVRANPPPGMTDFTAGLPVISAVRP